MAESKFTLTIRGPEGFQAERTVTTGTVRFGRQPGNDVVLPHTQISRLHAQIETTAEGCRLTDLGSSNGTALNGEKIPANTPMLLRDGDRIKIGPFEIAFSQAAAEQPAEAAAPAQAADPSIVSSVEPAPPEPTETPQPEPAPSPAPRKAAAGPKAPARAKAAPPPPPPPPAFVPAPPGPVPAGAGLPPGLTLHSSRLLNYLPGIYHTDFMARFLGIFEATLLPIEWTIDHFDLFLDPQTTPTAFLDWLAGWYGITFDSTWSETQRRTLLAEAPWIYARRGTRGALARVLEIYTGAAPEIDDQDGKLDAFTFTVRIPLRRREVDGALVEALVDAHKPAHTNYRIEYRT